MADDRSPEAELARADDEELLAEYHDTVRHLGVCAAEGQVDNQQMKWERALFDEILERMSGEDS